MFTEVVEIYSGRVSFICKYRLFVFIKLFLPLHIRVDSTVKWVLIGRFRDQLSNQIAINHLLDTFRVLLILFCSGNYHKCGV